MKWDGQQSTRSYVAKPAVGVRHHPLVTSGVDRSMPRRRACREDAIWRHRERDPRAWSLHGVLLINYFSPRLPLTAASERGGHIFDSIGCGTACREFRWTGPRVADVETSYDDKRLFNGLFVNRDPLFDSVATAARSAAERRGGSRSS